MQLVTGRSARSGRSIGWVGAFAAMAFLASPPAHAALTEETAPGEYRLSFVADDGNTYEPVLRVKPVDGKLTATYDEVGFDTRIENVRVKEEELIFDVNIDINGEQLLSTYFLKVDGEKVIGVIEWELGDEHGVVDVTGKRVTLAAKPSVPAALGTWRFEFRDEEGAEYRIPVLIEKSGEGWAVTVTLGDRRFASSEVTVEGGAVGFRVETEGPNGALTSRVRGKVSDGVMTGTIDHEGADAVSLNFTAPQIAPPGGLASLAGRWRIGFDTPDGQRPELDLHVESAGEALAGRIESADGGGSVVLTNLRFEAGKLNWAYTTDHEGLPAELAYHAAIDGDRLTGRIDYVYDGQVGVMEMTGERVR